MSPPPFVRPLSIVAKVVDEPLSLTPEAREELERRCEELRHARDAASVSGQSYLVHGGTP
jgi:hypothetical protein